MKLKVYYFAPCQNSSFESLKERKQDFHDERSLSMQIIHEANEIMHETRINYSPWHAAFKRNRAVNSRLKVMPPT